MKIVEETNMTVIEMEGIILKASINNWTMNTTNISGILEDLRYLIQSNMEDWVFQIQRILADELDAYRKKENIWMIIFGRYRSCTRMKNKGRNQTKEELKMKKLF